MSGRRKVLPRSNGKMMAYFGFYMSDELNERMWARASIEKRHLSPLVRQAIEEYLQRAEWRDEWDGIIRQVEQSA